MLRFHILYESTSFPVRVTVDRPTSLPWIIDEGVNFISIAQSCLLPLLSKTLSTFDNQSERTRFSGAAGRWLFYVLTRNWTQLVCNRSFIHDCFFIIQNVIKRRGKFAVKSELSVILSFCLILSRGNYFDKLLTFMIVFCVQLK